MSLFDKMFQKNKLDEALEKGYEEFAENNPVTRKAKATIEEAAKEMTRSLERELYGKSKDHSDDHRSALEDFDSISADWDKMIDQIAERELDKYTICPKCGAKNKFLDFNCVECGAELDLIPEEGGKK